MFCPQCNARIPIDPEQGDPAPSCPACGWGSHRESQQPAPRPVWRALRLGLLWGGAIIVLVGPWLGIRYLLLQLEASQLGPAIDTSELAGRWFPHYCWIMALYILLAWSVRPSYDRDNLGIFGGDAYSRHNPAVTAEQHYNRFLHTLSMLLFPGHLVVAALEETWRQFRPGKSARR